MNTYFYYIVPGVLTFFIIWVLLRFLVKKDLRQKNALFYGILSALLAILLVYAWYYLEK